MIRFVVVMALYLFLALQIEAGILPQIETLRVLSGHYEFVVGLRLLAWAHPGGRAARRSAGDAVGLIAALRPVFHFRGGLIGASIVSFVAAFPAGLLRALRLSGMFSAGSRFFHARCRAHGVSGVRSFFCTMT
jgi:hypothetical protein